MSLITANGFDAIETRLTDPRTGAWHADLIVDNPAALTGQVTLVIDANDGTQQTRVGTALPARTGVFVDTAHVRVVAGAGGLGTSATPRHYNGVSVAVVLGDLLSAAGETLSSIADQTVLSAALDAWTTTATPVGTLITLLLAAGAPGASWRMLPDGTLWVGTDTFPAQTIDSSLYQIREDAAETNSMRILVDAPLPLVGTVFEGRQVSATEAHVGQEGDTVSMTVWFEDGTPGVADRLRAALDAIAQDSTARTDRIDYSRTYHATVIEQSGATVDVQPDQVEGKALLADMAGVPLLLGLPGASVNGTSGGKVRIGWLGGDPSKPYAVSFDASNAVSTLVLEVLGQLFLGGKAGAQPAILGQSLLTWISTVLATHTHPVSGTVAGPSAQLAVPPEILASKVSVL
ncbi:MAG TPA: hypothetical protein VHG72_21960 [Polyangia bacterium]|nr:hypothetical protein [Polyangia bacterium]